MPSYIAFHRELYTILRINLASWVYILSLHIYTAWSCMNHFNQLRHAVGLRFLITSNISSCNFHLTLESHDNHWFWHRFLLFDDLFSLSIRFWRAQLVMIMIMIIEAQAPHVICLNYQELELKPIDDIKKIRTTLTNKKECLSPCHATQRLRQLLLQHWRSPVKSFMEWQTRLRDTPDT